MRGFGASVNIPSCDPLNDPSCLANLPDLGTPLPADQASVVSTDVSSWFSSGAPTVKSPASPTPVSGIVVIGGIVGLVLLFSMVGGRR